MKNKVFIASYLNMSSINYLKYYKDFLDNEKYLNLFKIQLKY